MEIQNIFERKEIKFIISKHQKNILLSKIKSHLVKDEFGQTLIKNIYYDTSNYDLIKKSLDSPVYKEKFRIRSYGETNSQSKVFLEIKKKYKGIVYKRRMSMSENDAKLYMRSNIRKSEYNGQILNEIDYFKNFYKDLGPKMLIFYERQAFYDKEDHDLRITFDENITYRENDFDLRLDSYGTKILNGKILMEIKLKDAFPLWLVKELNDLNIYKTSFSKYGEAYKNKIVNQEELLNERIV